MELAFVREGTPPYANPDRVKAYDLVVGDLIVVSVLEMDGEPIGACPDQTLWEHCYQPNRAVQPQWTRAALEEAARRINERLRGL